MRHRSKFLVAGLSLWLCAAGGVCPEGVQAQTYGKWSVEVGPAGPYAATINDSGHVIGQFCYTKEATCYWLIGFKTRCEQGARYPVLVNTDQGAEHASLLCLGEMDGIPGIYRYAFTDFDKADLFVLRGARIGVAVPLEGDQFRVIRFDLSGASTAVKIMRDTASTKMQPVRRGTRDEKL